jgi:hypothetical protein
MTEQLVLPLDIEVTPDVELTSEAAPRTSVLITEAEVVFSTAAAVPLRPATTMADPGGSRCSCRPPGVRDLGDR